MLRRFTDLRRCTIGAKDGELGKVSDLYFDDMGWAVRYLVVDTGRWLPGRQVLISPAMAGEVEPHSHVLPVALTKDQVRKSPNVDTHLPVSRQRESELAVYYGWPLYWMPDSATPGPGLPWGAGESAAAHKGSDTAVLEHVEPHLRSARDVLGYHIHARDGDLGHVHDFIAQVGEWMVRYLVIDTRDLWPGKKVLIPPHAVLDVDWSKARVSLDLTRETIQHVPTFDLHKPITREYEESLYGYYGWPRYWQ